MRLFSRERYEILKFLEKNKIHSLWHFTDIRNLPLIYELQGIRSKKYLEENGYLDRVYCGGNELSHNLDKSLGNWDKISLNFTPHTPMAYRKKREAHLVFLEIDIEVATFEDAIFTDCNATRIRNCQLREKGFEGLKNVKFDIINGLPNPGDQKWKKYVQAEVLVPDFIPLTRIKAVHFISHASKQYGEFLIGKNRKFHINKKTFADIYYNKWTVQFPYLQKVLVSNNEITEENYNEIKSSDTFIIGGEPFWIFVDLYAVAGTKALVIVKDAGEKSERTFKETSEWLWWPKFRIPKASKYYVELEVFLDDICWLKRRIEVRENWNN